MKDDAGRRASPPSDAPEVCFFCGFPIAWDLEDEEWAAGWRVRVVRDNVGAARLAHAACLPDVGWERA